jgi:hypothetical protein
MSDIDTSPEAVRIMADFMAVMKFPVVAALLRQLAKERDKAEARVRELEGDEITKVLRAADATLDLASANDMAACDVGDDKMQYGHLAWMAEQMPSLPLDKANRWLGWMQAAVVANGFGTYEEMREINRRAFSTTDRSPSPSA